jgi:P-type Ca2+ transporter type 2C
VDDNHGTVVARTMALTTFAFANLFFSFACRDERRSVFSLDILEDRRFLMMSGLSLAAIVLGTELGVMQRFLDTTPLSFRQWLVCIGLGLVVLVATEIRKMILRRQERAAGALESAEATPAPAAV